MVDLASLLAGEQKRKTFAQMLAHQSAETTPTPSWGAGLARALQGGMAGLIERGEKNASGETFDKQYPGAPPLAPAAPYTPQAMGAALSAPAANTAPGKIYSNDEPSPLDPPAGQDRQKMIATILGEAGNQAPTGQTAVASVIRNRAVDGGYGGDTPSGVVQAPNQFEPWNTAQGRSKMASAAADPNQAAAADRAISAAYGEGGQAPNDPTNGAKNFIAPKAQAALGRPMPGWAQGQGQDIGDHRFFGGAPQEPGQQPYQVAGPPTSPPQAGQPQSMGPAQRAAPQIPEHIRQNARSLWVEGHKAEAAAMLQPYTTPKDQFRSLTDPAERAKFGISPDDKNAYQVGSDNKVTAINPQPFAVNVNNQQESEFKKEGGSLIAKRFNEYVKGGDDARTLTADIGALRDIGSRITTGKTAQITAALGPYAEALGVKIDSLPDLQAFNAIVAKLQPRMRVAGSGATSDYEMRTFLEALPSIGKTPDGNTLIANTMDALQQHKLKAAEIAGQALEGQISQADANKQIRELPDPMEMWRKSKGKLPSSAASPSQAPAEVPAGALEEARKRGLIK